MKQLVRTKLKLGLAAAVVLSAALVVFTPALAQNFSPVPGGQFPSIVLDAAGNPVVSYQDDQFLSLALIHCQDPECYSYTRSLPLGQGGNYSSLVLDSSGNPVISSSRARLWLTRCNDPDCSPDVGGPESDVQLAFGVRDTSLALDANSYPVIAYLDYFNSLVMLAHCVDTTCTTAPVISTVGPADGSELFGSSVSLALDASGNPVIAYLGTGLMLAHCNDPDCAGGDESISVVDAGNVGFYASLKLDAAGSPVISYQERPGPNWDNARLKLAHCNDANCAGGDESVVVVDSRPGEVTGWSTSLQLNSAENPVIAYVDGSRIQLFVAQCNDPNCAGGDERFVIPSLQATIPDSDASLALNAVGDPVVAYYNFGNEALDVSTLWIQNGDFNRPLDPVYDWELASGEPSKDKPVCNDPSAPAYTGPCAFKFDVDGGEDVLQHKQGWPGNAGDKYEVRAHVAGSNLSANGSFKLKVTVRYTDNTNDQYVVDFPSGSYGYMPVAVPFTAAKDFEEITVAFQTKGKGTLLVDNVQFIIIQFTPPWLQ